MEMNHINLSSIKKSPAQRETIFSVEEKDLFNKHKKSLENEISLELKSTNECFKQAISPLPNNEQTKPFLDITNSTEFFKYSKIPKPCSKYSITLNKYSDFPTRIPKCKYT